MIRQKIQPGRIFLFLVFIVWGVQGCIHYFVDTETRIQIENKSEYYIRNLQIMSEDTNYSRVILMPDTLAPDSVSWVFTMSYSGAFDLGVEIQLDTNCGQDNCYQLEVLGKKELDPGSHFFRFQWDGASGELISH